MVAGSAENCAMTGAAGGGGGGGGAGATGGGGGGGGGIFFLQPAANTIKRMVAHTITIFREFSIKTSPPEFLLIVRYWPQTGVSLLPCVVSWRTCVPSASMVQIWCVPPRVDINTRCAPSGAQLGFSFRPSLCVNCV